MSTIPPLFNEEVLAWDRYAAAALSTTITQTETAQEAVLAAADLADRLIKEREKRIKAAKEHLFQH
ncbi:hypothetical protein G7013_03930 [Pseudomonas viridiflava]|uniref:Uncharacterized protein n=1 Tax=Pseudomonas viridiflava TaxID=33069 RepID=A0A3M5PJT9_PSEVI|nr:MULTISPECIES: hypothetical protein [Pseudomonas syringae group]MBA1228799.1 hypothetical protein [Pseudomonas viridiflava]MCF5706211.1 hypothetical protein [Pseudomonas syringae]RMT84585.1 hypothetical protein ALP40_02820 [Pseudomonas viridiflava]